MAVTSQNLPPQEIPVLLTSSVIAYDTQVKLQDTEQRIKLALDSVREWLKIEPHQPLVFCDGSSFDFSQLIQSEFPNARVECLFFENNQDAVRLQGRGYGEGEIVRYAINHSQLIAKANVFAKCSSKLWVQNFPACARAWQGHLLLQGIFLNAFHPWKHPRLSYIDTRFYIANLPEYRKYFENAHHRIDAANGYGLENVFLDVFLESDLHQALTPVAPVICGVGGGTGQHYKNASLKRRLKEDLRLMLVKRNTHFHPYFISSSP